MKRLPARPAPHGAAAAIAAAVLVLSTLNLSVPYLALAPGLTQDVVQLIEIDGTETTEVNGRLLLTTVALESVRIADAIRGWFDPAVTIVSRSAIIPPTETEQDAEMRTTAQMEESQLVAAGAALSHLGFDVRITSAGARIQHIAAGGPSTEKLRRGDVIVSADGRTVATGEDLRARIAEHQVGESIELTVVRGSEQLDITVQLAASPEAPTQPVIGVFVDDFPEVELPLAVDIESLGIGGPSAGLMFAIGVVELIDDADHVKGRIVAGTGEITLEGGVEPVGGVRQKLEGARRDGADLFLVPIAELDLACLHASDVLIVGVTDLDEAIRTLDGDVPAERTCA